jgi:hypothetical protein
LSPPVELKTTQQSLQFLVQVFMRKFFAFLIPYAVAALHR